MLDVNNAIKFKQRIRNGRVAIGIGVTFSDPAVSELLAEAGYDFTWIDMEHRPITIETALAHIIAVRGTNTVSFVRVPANDPSIIKPIIDLTPAGIVVPMVNTKEQAQLAVQACKYPPLGVRGYSPRRGMGYGRLSIQRYLENADRQTMVFVQIEHIDAIQDIDGIIGTQGLDGVCIGPSDLSGSMGKLGQFDDPEFIRAIDTIIEKVRGTDLFLGISIGFNAEALTSYLQKGIQWFNLNCDFSNLFMYSKQVIDAVREIESAGESNCRH